MKKILRLGFAGLAAVLALVGVGFATRVQPAQAQDDMMLHVCDSTLITLLYIAEHDYGFQSMTIDTSTYDKGQYAPLFDAMMEMMEGEEMTATEEPMMEGEMMEPMEDMTMLTPGNIEGEDEACTALRVELDTYLYTALTSDMMMMEGG
jgi:hypothetical protein